MLTCKAGGGNCDCPCCTKADAPVVQPATAAHAMEMARNDVTGWNCRLEVITVDNVPAIESMPNGDGKPTFERFTDRARKVMQLALQEAQRFNHEYVDTPHVLLGLAKEGSGVAANVLENLGVDLRGIRLATEKLIKPGDEVTLMGKLPRTPATDAALLRAIEEAKGLNHNYVGTEHVLLGLLGDETAGKVLGTFGLTADGVREEVLSLLGQGPEKAPYDVQVVFKAIEAMRAELKASPFVRIGEPPNDAHVNPAFVSGVSVVNDCGRWLLQVQVNGSKTGYGVWGTQDQVEAWRKAIVGE